MTIDIQPYLTSICADGEDNELQHLYTPTDALSRQLQPAKKSRFPFDLQLKVQTIPPPQREGQAPDQEQIERFNVLEGLRKYAADYNHVLLVGRPGSGKSTALQRLLWEEAQIPLEKLDKIPVLIELRQYKTSTLDLIHNFLKRHKLNIEKIAIEKLLDENRLLLLFDGVNELPNETARQDLNTFRQNYRHTSMIFTTRDIGVGGDLGIEKKLEMQPLTETQMQQFVRAYLPDTGEEMLRRLGEKLQSFAQTPLLLWLLCAVFAETGDIPANLGLVFRSFAQSYNSKFWDSVQVSDEFLCWIPELLQHLAFTMIQGEPPTEFRLAIDKQKAEEILTQFLKDKIDCAANKAKAWLEELIKHHLIQFANNNQIEFRHQLLQEYYAAECLLPQIKNLSDAKLKRDYLNYLKWTEPLALILALLDNEAQAVLVVKLALEVDLMLGARLAGEANKEKCQEKTVNLILDLDIHKLLKIEFLGITKSKYGINFLESALNHEDSYVRWKAVEALGEVDNEQSVNGLIQALDHKDSSIRLKAIEALGKIGNEQAVNGLIQALDHKDSSVRWKAASTLGKIDNEQAVNGLIQALKHEDFDVLWRAASALGKIDNEQAMNILIKALDDEDDENSYIRCKATEALGKIGNIQAVNILIKGLNHKDSGVRFKAAQALGEIGNEQAVNSLIQALNDEYSYVRRRAAEALGEIGKPEIIETIWKLYLNNPSSEKHNIILKIQKRCKFYNYNIFNSPSLEEDNKTDPLLDTLNKLNKTMSETPKYDFRGSNIGNFADTIQSGGKQETVQHIYAPEQKQNLAEAAKEIQQLLAQIAQKNPTIVQSQNQDVVLETIHQEIKRNPTIKARLLNALKSGGTEALKVALDAIFKNPIVSVSVETIKGFIEAE